jgi:hypothetical protein
MTLWVVPEGLAGASAAVETLTARLAAQHAALAPLITAVVPSAAEIRRPCRARSSSGCGHRARGGGGPRHSPSLPTRRIRQTALRRWR